MRFLFLLIIAVSGCHSGNTSQNIDDSTQLSVSDFTSFMKNHGQSYDKTKKVLVIPGVGCTGCISEAQYFFYENKHSEDHIFIFTAINDFKMFKLEVPEILHNAENVIVDKENELMDLGYNSIYPGYLRINNNRLEFEIFQQAK